MPRGPRLVRIASATALAASILVVRTSFFLAFSLHKKKTVSVHVLKVTSKRKLRSTETGKVGSAVTALT